VIISQPLSTFWVYFLGVLTWRRSIFFHTQNGVLHVLLIFWMIYIATMVADPIKDLTIPALAD